MKKLPIVTEIKPSNIATTGYTGFENVFCKFGEAIETNAVNLKSAPLWSVVFGNLLLKLFSLLYHVDKDRNFIISLLQTRFQRLNLGLEFLKSCSSRTCIVVVLTSSAELQAEVFNESKTCTNTCVSQLSNC